MADTLTLWTYDPVGKQYAQPVTKSLAAWGIADDWDAVIGGQGAGAGAEGITFRIPGASLNNSTFTFRSRVQVKMNGKIFFSGYVSEDMRSKTGSTDETTLRILSPWWYLENLVYQFAQQILTALDANNNPTFGTNYYTHFTLNLLPVTQFTPGQLWPIYTIIPQLFKSQAMIQKVLDFAKAQGAWLDYDLADILDVSVHPRDVLNITCADAILAQVENYDAIIWFDYSVDPPKLHCKQRKDLPAMSRSLMVPGSQFDQSKHIEGFKLRRRYDLACPLVQIAYEQPVSINGVNSITPAWDIYPPPAGWQPGQLPPAPVDSFKAMITTVPLRAITGNTHEKFIQTLQINLLSVDFWKAVKPVIDPAINPNAALEYADLAFIDSRRQGNLPNMIIKGGYADWMGGAAVHDELLVRAKYHRKHAAAIPGVKVGAHTWAKRALTTNLNFPGGVNYLYTTYSSDGDVIDNFMGMAQAVYTDLNPPNGLWEGTVPLFEDAYSGQVVMGKALNLNNTLAEHAAMATPIQRIGIRRRSGAIYYSLEVGPNKTISAQQIADRLRAAKYRYITVFNFGNISNTTAVKLSKHEAAEALSDAEATLTEHNINETEVDAQGNATANTGNVKLSSNAGKPLISAGVLDADGNPLTTKPGISLKTEDMTTIDALNN